MKRSRLIWSFWGLLLVLLASCTSGQPLSREETSPPELMNIVTLSSSYDDSIQVSIHMDDLVTWENEEAFFDFDSKAIANKKIADVYLLVSCGSDCFSALIAINEAKAKRMDSKALTYKDCELALKKPNLSGIAMTPGRHSCLLTNSNQIIEIVILELKQLGSNSTLTFQYSVLSE